MARPETRKERAEAHRARGKGKKKGKKKENRVTYITQRDGSVIPVVNYLDTFGQSLNRKDMREMLELYSFFGSEGKRMWKESRNAIRGDRKQYSNEMQGDSLVTGAERLANMQQYNRGMDGLVGYARRQSILQSNWMDREKSMMRNYMMQLRASAPLLAERMQRGINLSAQAGSPGGGGGGGGGGGSRGSGSGDEPAPSGEPGGRRKRPGKKAGDFEIVYSGLDLATTATALGIPSNRQDQITSNPLLMEFMNIVEQKVGEGQQPEMAVAELLPYYQGHPQLESDQVALSAASQLAVNHWKLAGNQIDVSEVPEYRDTDNPLYAAGLDPQEEAFQAARQAGSPVFDNFEFGGPTPQDQTLESRVRDAPKPEIGIPDGATDAIANFASSIGTSADSAIKFLQSDAAQEYGAGDLKDDIMSYGLGDLAGDTANVLTSDPRPVLSALGSGASTVADFWNPIGGSDGAREEDRIGATGPAPGPGWSLKPVRGSDGVLAVQWVRDSDNAVQQGELPSGRLPFDPAVGQPTPPGDANFSAVRPVTTTDEYGKEVTRWLNPDGSWNDFGPSEKFGEEGMGQDIWGSLIPGIRRILGADNPPAGDLPRDDLLEQIMAANPDSDKTGQTVVENLAKSIQEAMAKEAERKKKVEEARQKALEVLNAVRATQSDRFAKEVTSDTPPVVGTSAPQVFGPPAGFIRNPDGTLSKPDFQLAPLKPKAPAVSGVDHHLVNRS